MRRQSCAGLRLAAVSGMLSNPVCALQGFGQSVWLDDLQRGMFASGAFTRFIGEDGIRGVTSNPSTFEKAIVGSADYVRGMHDLDDVQNMTPTAIYEALAIEDVRVAADLLRPIYDATACADGFVSVEVSPYVAHDTDATIDESRRLWNAVDRANVMIKVPATVEALPAIRQLISEGINVNITLLFGVARYEEVARMYMEGLSTFLRVGGNPAHVSSVASFFVSRVDTAIDNLIAIRLETVTDAYTRAVLTSLLGRVAIANAKLAYQRYRALCRTAPWKRLAVAGAHPQRLLWASTSSKNARYRDVRYIEELIGKETVTTIPTATLDAFRDHGQPRATLESHLEDADTVIDGLGRVDISLREITDSLLEDGINRFIDALGTLRTAIGKVLAAPLAARSQN